MLKRWKKKKLQKKIRKTKKQSDEITKNTRRNILKEIRYDTPRGRALRNELVKGEKIDYIKLQKLAGYLASKELDDMVMKLTPNERKRIGLKGMRNFAEIDSDDEKSDDDSLSDDEDYSSTDIEKMKKEHEKWKVPEEYLEDIDDQIAVETLFEPDSKNYSQDFETISKEEGQFGGKKKGKTRRRKRNRKKSTRRRKRRRKRKTKRKKRRSKRRRRK